MAGRSRANGEGSIYPYRNGFAAYVWVTTPSGTRKRKYVYGQTRDDVHDKWLKLHQAAKNGPVATKTPKIGAYAEYWLADVIRPNRAPKTYVNYELFMRLYVVPLLGEKRLDRLTLTEAQRWANKLPEMCQCCAQGKDARRTQDKRRCCAVGKCCNTTPSARTIRDIRDCLRSMINHAIQEELVSRNVVALVKLPTVRKKKRKRWLTAQAIQFLESAREDDDPLYAAYVLILVMALRVGETLGFPVDGADFEAMNLEIEYQLQRVSRELLHRETKTEGSATTLPFPAIVGTSLQQRLAERDRDRVKAGDAWQECGLMFTTRFGTPIEPRNFNRAWDARCAKAGVPRITVHDGRRTCGSLLADLDVHPRVAMAILRHAQFTVTMEIYTEVSDESTRAALKKLGDSLGGGK